jgi:hypothetical protein
MNSAAWLGYFSNNQRADCSISAACGAALAPELRMELAQSLARFQLGEASGGRIAQEVETARDPALDRESRRAIQLYVIEEGRHARELYSLLTALGGSALSQHWSSDWFRRVRRCLGLRTKMLTMAAAEVVGIVYYGALRDRSGCPVLRETLAVIAREEKRHLDFQADWFARAIACAPPVLRPLVALGVAARFALILSAALVSVLVDHRRVLGALGVRPLTYIRACRVELAARGCFFRGSAGNFGNSSWRANQPVLESTSACSAGQILSELSSPAQSDGAPSRNAARPSA